MNRSNRQRRPGGGDSGDGNVGSSARGDRKIGGQGDGGNYGFDRHARGIPMGAQDSGSRRGAVGGPDQGGHGSANEHGGSDRPRGGSIGAGSQQHPGDPSSGECEFAPADRSASEGQLERSPEEVSSGNSGGGPDKALQKRTPSRTR